MNSYDEVDFEAHEKQFYEVFRTSLEAQNDRYRKKGNHKNVITMDQYRQRHPPEETIFQVGKMDEVVPPDVTQQHAHELAEKNKVIDTQREENDLLRNQLESQREFLELMRTEDEPMLENSVDIQSLYGKRFLFVGQIREFNSELRRAFPDSKFMESDTDDIKSLKVDGVVLLIRNMSHSMYYKVRQTGCLAELPRIYCNSRSINNIFQAMLTGMAGAA